MLKLKKQTLPLLTSTQGLKVTADDVQLLKSVVDNDSLHDFGKFL